MSDLKVFDIFKSAYLWLRCGIRPNLIPDDIHKDRIVFLFPDNEACRDEVKKFLADAGGIKTFCEIYKILRSELYLIKGKENDKNES